MLVGMFLVTFGIRYSMFAVAGRFEFPRPLIEALRYVPPAVLTAIIVPSVLIPNGETVDLSLSNAYIVGAMGLVGAALFIGVFFAKQGGSDRADVIIPNEPA